MCWINRWMTVPCLRLLGDVWNYCGPGPAAPWHHQGKLHFAVQGIPPPPLSGPITKRTNLGRVATNFLEGMSTKKGTLPRLIKIFKNLKVFSLSYHFKSLLISFFNDQYFDNNEVSFTTIFLYQHCPFQSILVRIIYTYI